MIPKQALPSLEEALTGTLIGNAVGSGNSADMAKSDGVQEIPLSELHPFKDHPFQVRADAAMWQLCESIREYGVLTPALARPRAEGGYELISGHRRKKACEAIGLTTMPVIVKDVDDDQAIVKMVDSNLQRETLLPSERAFAFKMKLEAMKRQAGRPSKENVSQLGTQKRSDQILAEQVGESRNQVQRYIRLTELFRPLLQMVDDKKVSFNAAVEVSYLNPKEQSMLTEYIEQESAPTLSQAKKLKEFSQNGKLNQESMEAIMTEDRTEPQKVTLQGKKLKKYFPPEFTPSQMEDVILRLLEEWQKKSVNSIK